MSITSSSSERITAAELERSKRARAIAKNWLEAESTRLKLAGLDPELEGDGMPGVQMRPSKYGRPTALDRVKEARISGLEIKEFSKGLGDESPSSKSSSSHVTSGDVAGAKARVVEGLVRMGKSAAEIEEYLTRVSPHLDVYALAANDPTSQALLFSKVMNGGGQGGLKDFVEAVRLANELRPQSQGSDVGQIANAMATALKTGAELASSKNNTTTDPLSVITAIAPLYKEMNETQRSMMQTQIEGLRQELQQRDPDKYLDTVSRYADLFGGRSQDPEPVAMAKLQAAQESSKLAFELEREKWRNQWEEKRESSKAKQQAELLNGITGTISKALESPVIKTLGQNVGVRLGTKNPFAPLAEAKAQSAQEVLANPMAAQYGFTCPKCQKTTTFSAGDLTLLKENQAGRWVCSCGAPYELGEK